MNPGRVKYTTKVRRGITDKWQEWTGEWTWNEFPTLEDVKSFMKKEWGNPEPVDRDREYGIFEATREQKIVMVRIPVNDRMSMIEILLKISGLKPFKKEPKLKWVVSPWHLVAVMKFDGSQS